MSMQSINSNSRNVFDNNTNTSKSWIRSKMLWLSGALVVVASTGLVAAMEQPQTTGGNTGMPVNHPLSSSTPLQNNSTPTSNNSQDNVDVNSNSQTSTNSSTNVQISSGSQNSSSNSNSVTINGESIPLPTNGSIHKSITNGDQTTNISARISSNSSSSNIQVNVNSNSQGGN